MTINRGSEWRKWDLHVHTPFSIYQRFGNNDEITWEKYIKDLENLPKEFAVIGINDYLFIDGYAKLKNEQTQNSRLSNLKLLPVVEFRIEKFAGIDFSQLKRINLHVIFSDEVSIETIQSQFLNTLEQSYYLETGDPWTRAITQQSVKELGKQIKSTIPETELHKYGSDLTEGFNNLNVKEEDIFKSLKKDCFKGKHLIAIGKTEWGDLKWTEASIATKKSIINKADIVFTASRSIVDFNKAKTQLRKQGVNDLLLDCSDAHYLSTETDKDRIGNCNTWIKAEPTFEGLKQIIYEPTERIKIQVSEPESEKLDNLMIGEVKFESSNNKFTPEIIKFNKNLNVIIGGKSSGKSILLYKIARTLNAEILHNNINENLLKNNILKYKDTEDNKYKDLYDLSEGDDNFNFSVKLFSGSEQFIIDRPNQSSILPSIKYIPQNHLSNLVDKSRKNGNTLKKLIRDLILEEPEYRKKYNDFVDHVIRNDRQREQNIDYYFSLKDTIKKKEEELLTRGDTKALKEGIVSNKNKLEVLSVNFTPDESQEYNNLNEAMNLLKIDEGKLNSDFEKIKNFNDEIKKFLNEFINRKLHLINSLEIEAIKADFLPKYNFIDKTLDYINEIDNEINKNKEGEFIQENIFKINLSRIKKEQSDIDNKLKPFIEKFANQRQIESIQKSVADDQKKLSEIEQFRKEIDNNISLLNTQKQKIFDEFEKNFELYKKILDELKPRISSIEDQDDKIDIIGSIRYNFPEFRKMIESVIDGRSFNNNGFEYLYQYTTANNIKTALSEIDFNCITTDLKNLFEKIENSPTILKGNNSERDACKKILTDYFFDHWDVKSDNDDIHKMSTGKASFVLLKLIIKLSKDKGPILIDQPEDNLDNRSVSKELVEYLKTRKKERQIILVTHNPNIVVNADAENIIVANQNGQNDTDSDSPYKFDYINGALENSFYDEDSKDLLKSMGIREHIAEIVEGGREAFKKREEKYGFKQ
ncbi:hypothetical protein FF18_15295 [Elizabethkingia anophelis]|uniref:TrlF family AAA-like ATPase n=1 Tax=Elizabethkingia anophelis TaxID=1117645 RepID=UPI0004E30720|nr:hypothetical protein [Elizabethkingia anophelis]KFC38755.1 hypothetical protein FF18_15295 [Elizabethkingia anophelis]